MAHASQHVNVVKVERMTEEDIEYRENTIAMPSLLACLLSVPVIDGHPFIHPSVVPSSNHHYVRMSVPYSIGFLFA